ncbi:erythromycin esterase family protein [Bhargavaea ullalensis]|uniref:Erythromycin esterase n=1 Tax=Bhargavaea ullalensis TaxID=1265685 RepID=A0ABV2GAE2_9BACL
MPKKLMKAIREHALPLDETSIGRLVEEAGEADLVLLGEASHGTAEFFELRAELSKRLIREKGFTVVAVEGDWPSAQQVNRYVRGLSAYSSAGAMLKASFVRWPEWMWANREAEHFLQWMREENRTRADGEKAGFYGLDLYSLYESIDEVLGFLESRPSYGVDLNKARKAFSCFEPYNRMPEHYALSAARLTDECIGEVADLLASIRVREERDGNGTEGDLDLKMNALVAKNAEEYYRSMLQDDAVSWNIRDTHMAEVAAGLIDHHGNGTKVIIWAHNTHVGDASETSMNRDGMINLGQLVRERYGKDRVFALGFGTYAGSVIAAEEWGLPFERMTVPPAKLGTWEGQCHAALGDDGVLLFDEENRRLFSGWTGHRAIGVVYNPEFEAYGNFVSSRVGQRYDGFVFFNRTEALHPL